MSISQEKNNVNKTKGKSQPQRVINKKRTVQGNRSNQMTKKDGNPVQSSGGNKNEKKETLKIIPLGGMEEIGKNITMFELNNEAILVDCGLAFPSEEMLGIDIVIPDLTYIEENKNKIKAIFITHGHEDHIGALPYLLRKINVPIYATKFTTLLIESKLTEHDLMRSTKMHAVKAGNIIHMGKFSVEFIKVNHSIPDACALAIKTPLGVIVHSGDFKVDYTPIENESINLARLGELGRRGVLAFMSDSTNSEKSGSSKSEKSVGKTIDKLFEVAADRRILVASFASNVYRIQQVITAAEKYGRKVALAGRSMLNVMGIALEHGYLLAKKDTMIEMEESLKMNDEEVVIVTTGSQGEPLAALSRMAAGDHRQIQVTQHDFIILSSSPVPGNEIMVTRLINDLMKKGAEVIHSPIYDVHVSGHASQDEQKLLLDLLNPKYFVPVHGEYKHLRRHAETALNMGMKKHRIIIPENGSVMVTDGHNFQMAGKVQAGETMIDGLGVGDVGSIVLRDRKHLSEDGLMIIVATIDKKTRKILAGPDIVSRGFVYVRESEELLNRAQKEMKKVLDSCLTQNLRDWNIIKGNLRDEMRGFVFKETRRRPMVLPIIMEV